jgi:acyl carrier protein
MSQDAGARYREEIRAYLAAAHGGGPSGIGDDDPLLGDLLDSMGVLGLATHLEETYGISIGAHEMDPANFGTLRAIAAFVAKKAAGA